MWRWAPVRVSAAVAAAAAHGALAFFRLLRVDAAGAVASAALVLARLILMVAPLVMWARRWPRHRLVWLPVLAAPFFPLLGVSIAAFSSIAMWILLALVSLAALVMARRKRWGAVALLPLVLCAEPALSHSPLADRVWTVGRLQQRCAHNDGVRPDGFTPELAGTRYYSVTRLDDRFALVTGERNSRWIEHRDSGYALEKASAVHGNLWQGCLLGQTLVYTKNGRLLRVERLADGERVVETRLEDAPGMPEYDLTEPACDAANQRVFVSELVSGGVREVSLRNGSVRRHQLGGFNMQYLLRKDGRLVGIDTARLVVYDPASGRVTEQQAAGIGVMGIDLCAADDAVAVADMTGRVRLFERDALGGYRLRVSRWHNVPRRLTFSPDCSQLAVTSADDQTVSLLRRSDLEPLQRYRVGPGLRDVAFLSPTVFAIADACSATLLAVPQATTVRSSPVP